MAGSLSTVAVTAGSGTNIETVTDGTGNKHPVGLIEYVDASLNPVLVSAANPLPVAAGANATATGNVTAADAASATASGFNGQSIVTGNPTAGSAVALAILPGQSAYDVQVTGTWVGTLIFERSFDGGTTWFPAGMAQPGTVQVGTTTTGNGGWHGHCGGSTNVRVRSTVYTSGTVVVLIVAGPAIDMVSIGNSVPIRDNSSGASLTIKAASTAAVATDPAAVVSLSPNSPGPVIAAPQTGIIYSGSSPLTPVIGNTTLGFANVSASGDNVLVAGTAGKKIRVLSFAVGPVAGAVNVYFKSATSGAVSSTKYLPASGGLGRTYSPMGHFETVAGEGLSINLSAAVNVGVDFEYVLV